MRLASILRTFRLSLAFMAALGSAVLPVYSHGLAHSANASSGNWIEVCTVGGMRLVSQDDPGTPQSPTGQSSHEQDCLYCASLAPILGLPSNGQVEIEKPSSQAIPIPPFPRHAHAGAWRSPYSRAPPRAIA